MSTGMGENSLLKSTKKTLVRIKSIYTNGIDETRDRSFTLNS